MKPKKTRKFHLSLKMLDAIIPSVSLVTKMSTNPEMNDSFVESLIADSGIDSVEPTVAVMTSEELFKFSDFVDGLNSIEGTELVPSAFIELFIMTKIALKYINKLRVLKIRVTDEEILEAINRKIIGKTLSKKKFAKETCKLINKFGDKQI